MKFSRRSLVTSGAAALAGLSASQVLKSRPSVAQANAPSRVAQAGGDFINLYSSRHYNTDDELYDNFKRLTGIQVNLLEGSADELLGRLKIEGSSSPADVFMTVDAGRLWAADQEGFFSPVSSSILEEKIPASLRHPNGHWFGFSKRARVIMYNKAQVNPAELSTYEALTDPKWRSQILIRSSSNIYNLSLMASLISIHGSGETEDWARGLVANFARPPEGNDTAQIRALASGLGGIAIANSYYLARLGKSGDAVDRDIFSKVGLFFPNQGSNQRGTHVNVSGAGVIASSPRKANAIKFLEYMASPTAQVFFAQGNNEYPVVDGTPLDPVVADFGSFKSDTVNVEMYGRNQAEAVRIADRVGWV
ncbi:MAG: Fe(3+) ABC transporter substrate-binding protein [Cyanothece sp. SIO2G6]|nr:Fe(3+) ABC transporter substrate-binding protein [Cyanothece sp. SIO2G6]